MVNIRQTDLYAEFMRRLKWQTSKIEGMYLYTRKFPLIPIYAKIQRPTTLPDFAKLTSFMQSHRIRSLTIEPPFTAPLGLLHNFQTTDPLTFTKNIHISLKETEVMIFNRFSEAKRRAVRRAQKSGVSVEIGSDINSFISLKNRTSGLFLGFMHTYGFIKPLWKTFYPKHGRVILGKINGKCEAGILLLYINKTAYYWMAAASKKGKRMFAPTLLVWETLQFVKHEGCTLFDFEGVYDDRYPKRNKDWQGFSKFKEGFGGKTVYYPQAFIFRLK